MTIAYRAGVVANVTRECAGLAGALGRIEDVTAGVNDLPDADSVEASIDGE
ncbi:hypothetical protein HGO38_01490 [Rhizobium sp. CG5]|uniref:hypothetical protein n=1 Tax=Rhizobium sp. CG5 TaxID=2726076 RepID=UPI00203335A4|nr:hypothetical protein [Rhizobium sp. CG5]MCM2472149.1 hypothetical protein [Rhizobium sp. CG5]